MDSLQWWRRSYERAESSTASAQPSELAVELSRSLVKPRRIIELGCGPAYDSTYFARSGHRVVASDFVRVEPAWSQAAAAAPTLSFLICDLRHDLPLATGSIDVVYARLSLHYFSDDVTSRIFREIHRVLTPGGLFVFLCKSTSDPLHGRGDALATNMFRINDKVYHFFDEDFALTCLGDRFEVEELWSGPQETFGEPSHVVRVRARARAARPISPDSSEDRTPSLD